MKPWAMPWNHCWHTHELPAAQLARHFLEAQINEKASQYLLLAGQQAARLLAFDEAIVHYRSGLSELKRHSTFSRYYAP
jgi:predicted ATPase